jgi:hypothetical protein
MLGRLVLAGALAGGLWPAAAARAQDAKEPTAEQVEFFEKKIRPVLIEKCYSCHSHQAKKLKGEYYLDARDTMIKGGESGKAAIVPGDPDKSPFIIAIRRTDEDLAMPPKEKDALSKEQVKDFEEWVKMGVPDPRKEPDKSAPPGQKADAGEAAPEAAKDHWAFKKPQEPAVPAVKDAAWAKSPIDAFVLAKLESKNMAPAAAADKRTLIRRATFDLTGLPPTPEEVAAFEADASPDAFAKVVDRLLASAQYGERWGRYWLDVARYADTKGYVFEEERRFPYSYTYRDYVIRAFNEDLPYDQFLIHQIAADRLDLGADKRPLAAMGFLTLGRRFLQNQPDIIDDRIDVVTRGTMGLTVQCARCHDHKYDPIPIDDYYSLYGIFASSVEPATLPSIGSADNAAASLAFETELRAREAAAESFLAEKSGEFLGELRTAAKVADYLMAAQFMGGPHEAAYATGLDVNRRLVQRWTGFLAASRTGHDAVFAPFQAYAAIPPAEFAANAPGVTEQLFATADPAKPINALVAELFKGKAPASMREAADRYGQLIASHSQEQGFEDASKESLRMVLHGLTSPLYAVGDERRRFLKQDARTAYNQLRAKVEELRANDPGAPPLAMVLNDAPNPGDAFVFKRGNPGLPGPQVPRRFLECVSGPDRKPFTDGSGRLELARAIASKDNPLTARVMVNRVWLNHFGAGLVRTPSDFGVRCDPPAHPELLDWLALRFMDGNWSVKNLHRLIMNSATYQQASDGRDPAYATADPENTLLWRMSRRRLDFEAMRDTFLAVAGQLDRTAGGKPVDIIDAGNNRRSIYGFIERQNLPGLFRTFDFASPDTHSPNRFFTTVPQQSLFMLNSPLIERVTRQLAGRPDVGAAPDAAARIDRLYRLLFGRAPSADELADGAAFVAAEADETVRDNPWQYGYGRFDEASNRVVDFRPLAHFSGDRWQGGEKFPDEGKLSYLFLSPQGGHVGPDAATAAIRRWVAPFDGTVSISGTAAHRSPAGDGVLARVVSSQVGQISTWTLARIDAATNLQGVPVRKGDTIDFVVECRGDQNSDVFEWAPTVRANAAAVAAAGDVGAAEYDAAKQFAGPGAGGGLSPWEKYAQVLLLSNEFMFVD